MKRLSLLSLAVVVSLTGCFDSSDDDNTAQNTNRAPEADSRALTTQTEVAITDQLNATDADGDSLTYAVSTGPMFGTLSLSSGGAFTYTPNSEYTGADSFSYTVSDGTAFAVTGFIDITVEALEVSFNDTVRTVFTLDANAEPVSVNGREYIEDANSPGNFDDLLDN